MTWWGWVIAASGWWAFVALFIGVTFGRLMKTHDSQPTPYPGGPR